MSLLPGRASCQLGLLFCSRNVRVIKTGKTDQYHLVEEQYIQILLLCLLELACLSTLSSLSHAALEDAWSFSCHVGPSCKEIQGLVATQVDSGWEEDGVDEGDASEWLTGEDGDWSLEEEEASTLMGS